MTQKGVVSAVGNQILDMDRKLHKAEVAAATWGDRAAKEASRSADLQSQVDELLAALKTIGTHTITNEDGDEIEVLFGNIGKIGDVITKYTGETK